MCIYSSGARFRAEVEVAGTITGKSYGTFDQGYIERGAVIPLPTVAALTRLNTYATQGGMSFTALAGGTAYQARLRIEFLPLDLDGDGRVTGPTEGFFRVYADTGASNPDYVTATDPTNSYANLNCTDAHTVTGTFRTVTATNPASVSFSIGVAPRADLQSRHWFTSGVTGAHDDQPVRRCRTARRTRTSSVQQAPRPGAGWAATSTCS